MAGLIGCWDSGGARLSERTGERFARLLQEEKHPERTARRRPLVALIDRSDPHHRDCCEALAAITYPLGTVWPAFTEAMYLLRSSARAQSARGRPGRWRSPTDRA